MNPGCTPVSPTLTVLADSNNSNEGCLHKSGRVHCVMNYFGKHDVMEKNAAVYPAARPGGGYNSKLLWDKSF